MKKLTFLTVVIVFFLACGNQEKPQKNSKKTEQKEFVLQAGDSIIFENKEFRLVQNKKEKDNNDKFTIYDLKNSKSFTYSDIDLYFLKIYNNYLLFQEFVSDVENLLVVIDMTTGKKVFEASDFSGEEKLKIIGDKAYYWDLAKDVPDNIKFDCKEDQYMSIEHIEKFELNLNNLQTKSLKEYDCTYFP